jgi:uncharacterized protein (TIGR02646 family)
VIHLRRVPLPESAARYLDEKSTELTATASDSRAAKATQLWQGRSRVHFQAIRGVLQEMCSGNERCMYCEDSAGAHIDHFRPRSVDPLSSFAWENYLLACSVCNSNYKRDEFPTNSDGEPLLLNPTVDEPRDHLALSPGTGRYLPVEESRKGPESIRVFGLNRAILETARRDAWRIFELGIIAYGRAHDAGESSRASEIAGTLSRLPCTGVLKTLIAVIRDTELDLVDAECREVCTRRPEIFEWECQR